MTGRQLILSLSLFGVLALVISGVAAGGGHGTYVTAKLLFPLAMLSTRFTGSVSPPALVLAVAQYPLYGWLLSRARSRGSLPYGVAFLAAAHALAAAVSLAATRAGAFAS